MYPHGFAVSIYAFASCAAAPIGVSTIKSAYSLKPLWELVSVWVGHCRE